MKRITSIIVICVILTSLFIGCSTTTKEPVTISSFNGNWEMITEKDKLALSINEGMVTLYYTTSGLQYSNALASKYIIKEENGAFYLYQDGLKGEIVLSNDRSSITWNNENLGGTYKSIDKIDIG